MTEQRRSVPLTGADRRALWELFDCIEEERPEKPRCWLYDVADCFDISHREVMSTWRAYCALRRRREKRRRT